MRRGVAPLEVILALPVIAFLFVMIFYVAKSSLQKAELVSRCRNQSWEERYQSNRANIRSLAVYNTTSPENGVIENRKQESIQTGLFFDKWQQDTATKHRVLAQSWDYQVVHLDSHPIYAQGEIIGDLAINFGPNVIKEALKEELENFLEEIAEGVLSEIIPDEILDFIPDAATIGELKAGIDGVLDELLENIDDLVEDALDYVDSIDSDGLMDAADALIEDIESEIARVKKELNELENLLSANGSFRDTNQSPEFPKAVFRFASAKKIDQEDIDRIKEKIQQLKIVLDDLKALLLQAQNMRKDAEKLINDIQNFSFSALKNQIRSLGTKAKNGVISLSQQIDGIIATLKSNPLDLTKLSNQISKLMEDAKNIVKTLATDLEAIVKPVKKIIDDIDKLWQDIQQIRNQFDKLRKSIENLFADDNGSLPHLVAVREKVNCFSFQNQSYARVSKSST